MKNYFNPKIKEMFEEFPEQSVLGFYWACTWRFQLFVLSIYLGIILLAIIIGSII